jgi:hypothetical protein
MITMMRFLALIGAGLLSGHGLAITGAHTGASEQGLLAIADYTIYGSHRVATVRPARVES